MSISIIDSVFSCQQLTKVRANLLKRFAKIYIVCLTGEWGVKADLRMCTRSGLLKDYLRRTYGEQVQKIMDIYGKELDRQAKSDKKV